MSSFHVAPIRYGCYTIVASDPVDALDVWSLAESFRGASILLEDLCDRILSGSSAPTDGCIKVDISLRDAVSISFEPMRPDSVTVLISPRFATSTDLRARITDIVHHLDQYVLAIRQRHFILTHPIFSLPSASSSLELS